jgi:hypothetical protein
MPVQIVRIESRVHVAQAIPVDGRDLSFRAPGDRKASDCRAARIVERQIDDPCCGARLTP